MNARDPEHIPSLSDPATTTKAAYTKGRLNNHNVEILLDSGASCSVVGQDYVSPSELEPMGPVRLVNADGRGLAPVGLTTMKVQLPNLTTHQTFVVVERLSAPAILGCDFLTRHGLIIDFEKGTFHSKESTAKEGKLSLQTANSCMLVLDGDCPQAAPFKDSAARPGVLDTPKDYHPALGPVLKEHERLFQVQLGKTNVAEHVIDTGEAPPVKVPPRPIPFQFQDRVRDQLQEMATDGTIRPSNSPWCAPAVYVPKNNGEIRICVDYVQLNKSTKKDSYPVPRAEGPQQKLAYKQVFSKIDLRSAYWQFPMEETSIEKTAFCPGPGYGLWEFTVMPYGLTGATQTCQRGLDSVLNHCKDCVDNYVDDCIVFSDNMESHISDLRRVLSSLLAAGFTLRGSKCFFGRNEITHLGFQYSRDGVTPTEERSRAVADWPIPTTKKEVRSFLGLANFCRRFVPKFADIARPLTDLTAIGATFQWQEEQQRAFDSLKQALMSPPALDYPRQTDTFVLTTDASDTGIGAVLATARGTVVEYASRMLTAAEKKYATIEKECLAIVWAVHKLRHYLIGARFTLETDHKPLEWLQSARISRARSQRLERWSLELRAYEFDVVYRPGATNQHADALSRKPISLVALNPPMDIADLAEAQQQDPMLSKVHQQLQNDAPPPVTGEWRKHPLKRYRQLWSQLVLHDAVICRKVQSPTMRESRLLLVVPKSQQKSFLEMAHEESGHQGIDRTLARLSEMAYWVGQGRDVVHHCRYCARCQFTKSSENKPAPLLPVIASKPWELVAVDILKVPPSSQGNQYILVVQDYFSKWPFARALPDQKAHRIVQVLKDDVFSLVGPPQKLHSDQGRNFESSILADLCTAFGVKKSHTTPYHPMGDGLVERMNRSLLTLMRSYVDMERDWEEHLQLLLFLYRTSKHATTGLSPYEVLFGSNPPSLNVPHLPSMSIPEPSEYSACLKSKVLELRELVDANLVESADQQRRSYHGSEWNVKIRVGQQVLLNNPTKGKLDPRWTGPWIVTALQGSTTVLLKMGSTERAVHINRVRPLLTEEGVDHRVLPDWSPPLFHHEECPPSPPLAENQQDDPTQGTAATGLSIPDIVEESSAGPHRPHPESSPPRSVTTRSGRLVKPVQRYGHV